MCNKGAATAEATPCAKVMNAGNKKRVVMVTGGTGLVGKGIEAYISECPEAAANESW